ncbi:MAG TPA: TonB-dependent receptor [Saprospiraceae bacterium]|nr:TonB-dependent receptor [Saprospiraceae bacterium]
MNRFQLLYIILFVHLYGVNAQQNIKGKLIDASTGESLPGAVILVGNSAFLTDEVGLFELKNIFPSDSIKFSYTSYGTKILLGNQLSITDLVVRLFPENILLTTTVITASRFERPLSQSSISVDILKSDRASNLNSNTIKDAIDRVPGVQILDGQVNIRGGAGYSYGAGTRAMLLYDDLPILQPDAGFPYWDDLPLENVGQVEILKGAASSLYGSAAMNGVIHFRSMQPTIDPFTSVSISNRVYLKPGNNNQWWGKGNYKNTIPSEQYITLVHRRKWNTIDYSGALSYVNKISYNLHSDLSNFRFNGMIRKKFNDRLFGSVTLNANAGESSGFFYWKNAGLFEGDTSSLNSSSKIRFSIDPRLHYTSKKNYQHKLISRWYQIKNDNSNNQSNQSSNLYSEYQINKVYDKIGLSVATGMLASYSFVEANLYSNGTFNNTNLALYLQADQKIFNKLILNAGCRYEYFRIHGPSIILKDTINPIQTQQRPVFRLGMNYEITKATFLRASWGQGFRFPTLAEKYIQTTAGILNIAANPKLNPEYGTTTEIGLKQGFRMGSWQGLADVSLFRQEYRDMMEFGLIIDKSFKFSFQSQNIGDTKITGGELSILTQGKIGSDLKCILNGGYTYIDPKFNEWDSTGKEASRTELEKATRGQLNALNSTSSYNILKYRSKHLLRYDIQFEYKSWYFGSDFTYASNVAAIDWLFEVDLFIKGIKSFRQENNYGYRVHGFRVGKKWKRLEIQLNVHNAFNELYAVRPGLMEAPRSISGRIQWNIKS